MKVKVTTNYYDTLLKKDVAKNEELEVVDERGETLVNAGVASEIKKQKEEKGEEAPGEKEAKLNERKGKKS